MSLSMINANTFFTPLSRMFISLRGAFLFIFLLGTVVVGQIHTQLNPEVIYIGDTASLQITITVDSHQTVELPQLGDSLTKYLEVSKIKIDSLQRGRNLNILQNITITGFEPGDFLVKSLPIVIDGKTYLSDSFSLQIKNVEVDEEKQGLYPLKKIMDQEITWWEKYKKYVYYTAIATVLILIIIIIIWLFLREKKKNKYVSTPLLPPYEEALENLKKLDQENHIRHNRYYEFYSSLSFILRRYFARRFNFPAMALLSTDLSGYMLQKEYLTKEEANEFNQFLIDSDFTKYARKIPSEEKHIKYRDWVEEIIHRTKPLLENTLPDHIPNGDEDEKLRKLDRS